MADSFQGFPADDADHPDRGNFAGVDYLAVPLEVVRENFARLGYEEGVRFLPGFFEDTLPGLAGHRWSLVRLDGDSYEATWTALNALYPGLSVGGYVVVDDYGALEECREAVDTFRARHGITEPIEEVDWTSVRWRRTSDAPVVGDAPAPAAGGRLPARPVERRAITRVVSVGERVERRRLEHHIAELTERLRAAEREVGELRGAPLRGPRAWLRLQGARLQRLAGRRG